MKYALISDIHGNIAALESVLADIELEHVDLIVNLGDSLNGPLWPEETAKALMDGGIVSVLGNGDEQLLANPDITPTFSFTARQLSRETFDWIRTLGMRYEDECVFAFHAKPHCNDEYLMEYVENAEVRTRDGEAIKRYIRGIAGKTLVCGHSHIERVLMIDDCMIVNAGSVGLPAYSDDEPYHKMETFNPCAKYAILENGTVEFRYIRYDFKAAAKRATENGRMDWAQCLLSGRVGS